MGDHPQQESSESVDRIRDIIFGPKMRDYEQRFEAVVRDLSRLQQELDQLAEQLAAQGTAQTASLQALRQELRQAAIARSREGRASRLNTQLAEQVAATIDRNPAPGAAEAERFAGPGRRSPERQLTDQASAQEASQQALRQELRKADADLREELRQIAQRLTDDKPDRSTLGDLFIELGNHVKTGGSLADLLQGPGSAEANALHLRRSWTHPSRRRMQQAQPAGRTARPRPRRREPTRIRCPADPYCLPVDPALEELREHPRRPGPRARRRARGVGRRPGAPHQRLDRVDHGDVAPVLGDMIRHNIHDSRDEMIEALYPIIGQLIGRAVAEAIRDLARTIDTRMRAIVQPGKYAAPPGGRAWPASRTSALAAARCPALPCDRVVPDRIGRAGCCCSTFPTNGRISRLGPGQRHAHCDPGFAQDAFGRGQEGQLDEIQYGTRGS